MRPLVKKLISIAILPTVSFAEGPRFDISSSVNDIKGTTLASAEDNVDSTSSVGQSLDLSSGSLNSTFLDVGIRLRAGITRLNRSLENYIITGSDGSTSSIVEQFDGKETQVRAGMDLIVGNWTYSLDGLDTYSDSPLASKSVSSQIAYSLYRTGTNISLAYSKRKEDRPLSFFVDPLTFQSRSRSEELNTKSIFLEYRQILSERITTQFIANTIDRVEDRPRSYGVRGSVYYALLDNMAANASLEVHDEKDNQLSGDGRGRFNLQAYELGLIYEPQFNLLVKIQYGMIIEKEFGRGTLPEQTVGTDSYALGVEFKTGQLTFNLNSKIDDSNTEYQSANFSGGLSWEI